MLGIWAEEIDSLTDDETNSIRGVPGNELGLQGSYQARHLCELINLEGASAQAVYGGDFYAGRPALTVNRFGDGKAWYVASRNDASFQRDFFMAIAQELALPRALDTLLPPGVTAQRRTDGESEFIIVQNYSDKAKTVELPAVYVDMSDAGTLQGEMALAPWGCRILTRKLA